MSKSFELAREIYGAVGVDVEAALARLQKSVLSLHAWQGDDVKGFEDTIGALTGGCQVTGNYPGCARNSEELRKDLDFAMTLIPCRNLKVCLQGHEIDSMKPGQDRDSWTVENFAGWMDWAVANHIGMEIAPAFYSHPKLDHGLSLSHESEDIRKFWIRHAQACRRVSAEFARRTGVTAVCNEWAPDGYKDSPADRRAPRERLQASLDEIFSEKFAETEVLDAVESKLFGIGVESYTVGSHDFYLSYAARNNKLICLDTGHFHPTENIADKISAITAQGGRILLHVSRGVRWDSDHVILLDDPLMDLARECVRNGNGKNIFYTLDYFDASINRVAAWVIGARNWFKATLIALLEPSKTMCEAEACGDFTLRMAEKEAVKSLPWGAVWNEWLERNGMPSDAEVIVPIREYEKAVLLNR
ncbi:MAG: L-rhamnose isomerase [Lentisphaeria bacterium]|nr:L-rhamnose isomerase [Lentisphaeria bacterium]